MHCTNCGSAIAEDARFCSGCGAGVAGATRLLIPQRRSVPAAQAKLGGCGFVLLVIGALYVAARLTSHEPAPAVPTTAAELKAADKAAAVKAKTCDDAVAALFKAGVAKARPAADRLEVDELAWAELPAAQKRVFAAAVRCSALGGTDGNDLTEGATIEGFHSGKTLAIATSAGVTLE